MKPEIDKAISDAVAGKDTALAEKDAEIQALKKQLAALNA